MFFLSLVLAFCFCLWFLFAFFFCFFFCLFPGCFCSFWFLCGCESFRLGFTHGGLWGDLDSTGRNITNAPQTGSIAWPTKMNHQRLTAQQQQQQQYAYTQNPQVTVVESTDGASLQRRSVAVAYLLWFFFGWFGIHRFYLERPLTGIIWFLTLGIAGVGWLIDLFLIPGMVAMCNSPKNAYVTTTTTTTYNQPQQVYTVAQPSTVVVSARAQPVVVTTTVYGS